MVFDNFYFYRIFKVYNTSSININGVVEIIFDDIIFDFNHIKSDGSDIIVTDDEFNIVPFTIYNFTWGEEFSLKFVVNIPASEDRLYYMFYGDNIYVNQLYDLSGYAVLSPTDEYTIKNEYFEYYRKIFDTVIDESAIDINNSDKYMFSNKELMKYYKEYDYSDGVNYFKDVSGIVRGVNKYISTHRSSDFVHLFKEDILDLIKIKVPFFNTNTYYFKFVPFSVESSLSLDVVDTKTVVLDVFNDVPSIKRIDITKTGNSNYSFKITSFASDFVHGKTGDLLSTVDIYGETFTNIPYNITVTYSDPNGNIDYVSLDRFFVVDNMLASYKTSFEADFNLFKEYVNKTFNIRKYINPSSSYTYTLPQNFKIEGNTIKGILKIKSYRSSKFKGTTVVWNPIRFYIDPSGTVVDANQKVIGSYNYDTGEITFNNVYGSTIYIDNISGSFRFLITEPFTLTFYSYNSTRTKKYKLDISIDGYSRYIYNNKVLVYLSDNMVVDNYENVEFIEEV